MLNVKVIELLTVADAASQCHCRVAQGWRAEAGDSSRIPLPAFPHGQEGGHLTRPTEQRPGLPLMCRWLVNGLMRRVSHHLQAKHEVEISASAKK